jgi:hypothetical protein
MISGLLTALVVIAIVSLIGWCIIAVVPMPQQVKTVLWVIVGVLCLLFLLDAIRGVSIS